MRHTYVTHFTKKKTAHRHTNENSFICADFGRFVLFHIFDALIARVPFVALVSIVR